jgi:two-component system cell cycle sensor histidine kinase PleC
METHVSLVWYFASAGVLLAIVAAALGMAVWQNIDLRRRLAAFRVQSEQSHFAEEVATRILRLSADELRQPSMVLLSHADKIRLTDSEGAEQHADAISALATRFLDLADDMQDHAVSAAEPRVLRDEVIMMGPLIDEAITAVSVMLGPTRRNWQVQPKLRELSLWADRRAVRQILRRVLANGARFSADGDWIDIGVEDTPDGVAVVIEDEGAGLTASDPLSVSPIFDSRGIGLGLSLSRALMHAHGGRLTVVSAPRVGTRYALVFPSTRLLHGEVKVLSSA